MLFEVVDVIDLHVAALWGACSSGYVVVHDDVHRSWFYPLPEGLALASDHLHTVPTARPCLGALGHVPEGTSRGTELDVGSVGALAPLDLDVLCPICWYYLGDRTPRPGCQSDALGALYSVAPLSTCIVDTPHLGMHPVWSFTEAVTAATAKAIAIAIHDRVEAAWRARGWDIDRQVSPARLLRNPGSMWKKPHHSPGPCRLLDGFGRPVEDVSIALTWPKYAPMELAQALEIDLQTEAAKIEDQLRARAEGGGHAGDRGGGGVEVGMPVAQWLFAPPLSADQQRVARSRINSAAIVVAEGRFRRSAAAFRVFDGLRDAGATPEQIRRWVLDELVGTLNDNYRGANGEPMTVAQAEGILLHEVYGIPRPKKTTPTPPPCIEEGTRPVCEPCSASCGLVNPASDPGSEHALVEGASLVEVPDGASLVESVDGTGSQP